MRCWPIIDEERIVWNGYFLLIGNGKIDYRRKPNKRALLQFFCDRPNYSASTHDVMLHLYGPRPSHLIEPTLAKVIRQISRVRQDLKEEFPDYEWLVFDFETREFKLLGSSGFNIEREVP